MSNTWQTKSIKKPRKFVATQSMGKSIRVKKPRKFVTIQSKGKGFRVRKLSSRKNGKGMGRWLVGAIILLSLFYVLFFLLPRVDITIIPESRVVSFEEVIILTTEENFEIEEILAGKVLKGKKVFVTDSIEDIFETTGEKDIGDKSEGMATFLNFTGLSQLVFIEDGLETNAGKLFTVKSALTIPAASVSPAGDIVPGRIEAGIVALEPGADSNISPQKIFIQSVPPDKQLKIYAEINSALLGGTSEVVQVISQADIDAAQEELKSILTTKILEKISQNLPVEEIFMSETLTFTREDYSSKVDINIDDETGEFSYTLDATTEIIVYKYDDLNNLIKKSLSEKLNASEMFLSDEPKDFEIVNISNDPAGNLLLALKADWLVSQPIDLEPILTEILGVREADARRIILRTESVADVRFNWNLAIAKRVPNIESHVNINIGGNL